MVDVPEVPKAGYARLHDVLPEARRRAYEYPSFIHHPLYVERWGYAAVFGLAAFLVVYRTYRIVRWVRRRRDRAHSAPDKQPTTGETDCTSARPAQNP